MLRCMLRAKIHHARVTDANLEYEGSITVDEDILDAAGIVPYEKVMITNLNNGERLDTYVIPGKRNSGEICLNGPTARKGVAGDRIIIFTFGYCGEDEIPGFHPVIVRLDSRNRILPE